MANRQQSNSRVSITVGVPARHSIAQLECLGLLNELLDDTAGCQKTLYELIGAEDCVLEVYFQLEAEVSLKIYEDFFPGLLTYIIGHFLALPQLIHLVCFQDVCQLF